MSNKTKQFLQDWCQLHLKNTEIKIQSLDDILFGTNLTKLLSAVVKESPLKEDSDAIEVLKFLSTKNVGAESIKTQGIMDKIKEEQAKLIWSTINFAVQCISVEGVTGEEALMAWCQKTKDKEIEHWKKDVQDKEDQNQKKKQNQKKNQKKNKEMEDGTFVDEIASLKVENFSDSFDNGWILYALVRNCLGKDSHLMDYKKDSKKSPEKIVEQSFILANENLGIPCMLEVKDVIQPKESTAKFMVAYIASVYFVQREKEEHLLLLSNLQGWMKKKIEFFQTDVKLDLPTIVLIEQYFHQERPWFSQQLKRIQTSRISLSNNISFNDDILQFAKQEASWKNKIFHQCTKFDDEQLALRRLSDFVEFARKIKNQNQFSLEGLDIDDLRNKQNELIGLQQEFVLRKHHMKTYLEDIPNKTSIDEMNILIEDTDDFIKNRILAFKSINETGCGKEYSMKALNLLVSMEHVSDEINKGRVVVNFKGLEELQNTLTTYWNETKEDLDKLFVVLCGLQHANPNPYTKITIKSLQERMNKLNENCWKNIGMIEDLILSTPKHKIFIRTPSFTHEK